MSQLAECEVCFAPATVLYSTDLGAACEPCYVARTRWLSMTPRERADEARAIAEYTAENKTDAEGATT